MAGDKVYCHNAQCSLMVTLLLYALSLLKLHHTLKVIGFCREKCKFTEFGAAQDLCYGSALCIMIRTGDIFAHKVATMN